MSHVGWRSASSGVTPSRSRGSRWRKGPPEAVRTILRTLSSSAPSRHWKTALCSLSTGINSPPFSSSACMTSGPPITSDSLFASASRFPTFNASNVGSRPAAPTSALTTISTSGCVAAASTASQPAAKRVPGDGTARENSPSARTANSGRCSRTCSSSASALRWAVSATTRKRSGNALMTSSVVLPIDPVEPRTATPRASITPPRS